MFYIYFYLRFFCESDLHVFGSNQENLRVRKTTVSSTFLIRLWLQGYRCKSDIFILSWRVTWTLRLHYLKVEWFNKLFVLGKKSFVGSWSRFEQINTIPSTRRGGGLEGRGWSCRGAGNFPPHPVRHSFKSYDSQE